MRFTGLMEQGRAQPVREHSGGVDGSVSTIQGKGRAVEVRAQLLSVYRGMLWRKGVPYFALFSLVLLDTRGSSTSV